MGEFLGVFHVRVAVALAVCAAAGPSLAAAHELGTTRVIVSIRADGRYSVDISTDAASLVARLEMLSRRPQSATSGALRPLEYEQRIRQMKDEMLRGVALRFDETSARPALDVVVEGPDDLTPPRAVIRLTGAIPDGARAFTWRYDLASTAYALIYSKREAWLDPNETSPAIGVRDLASWSPRFAAPAAVLLGLIGLYWTIRRLSF